MRRVEYFNRMRCGMVEETNEDGFNKRRIRKIPLQIARLHMGISAMREADEGDLRKRREEIRR